MENKETKLTKKMYAACATREWGRLVQDPFHRLEFETTMRYLKKHLPKNGLILDAGGGPGRYTIELAKLGYDVVLLDLVPENLDFAQKQIAKSGMTKRIKRIDPGTITDLSRYPGNSFDAVICLGGPLSHVHPAKMRAKAVSELLRVAGRNAPVFVSVMGKYGVMLATPEGWPREVNDKKAFQRFSRTGDDYHWCGHGYCHFFTAQELKTLFSESKAKTLEMVGLEGLNSSCRITNQFAKEYPKAWKNWVDAHYQICTQPSVVDASGHMMIIVRKK
ncbi:class I SAM-dependent methyltransferase [candidate division TA06 bacterium]|uniref:Class I SAM-dependent methyltransferase n=1 Tax=candidate division TA06 bacterium TaxID=2250710 RepID=A0A933ID81_UNCT6|nr:class I SAM-dependent methyltransferase [candidate division TA06 bacterium]